ncbi:MAG: DUF6491 family protein [Sphingomicrobium sp.]
MRPMLLLLPFALASCAPTPMQQSVAANQEAENFAREVAGRVPAGGGSCISTFGSENLRVVNRSTLAYGTGRTVQINRLAAPCPGLDQFNAIIVEANGGQYCRGDRIRALEPGGIIPGPVCHLGNWTAYNRQ